MATPIVSVYPSPRFDLVTKEEAKPLFTGTIADALWAAQTQSFTTVRFKPSGGNAYEVTIDGYECGLCQGAGEMPIEDHMGLSGHYTTGGGDCPAGCEDGLFEDEEDADDAESWEPEYEEPERTPWEDLD